MNIYFGQILSFKINFQHVHILFAYLIKLGYYFIFITKQKV